MERLVNVVVLLQAIFFCAVHCCAPTPVMSSTYVPLISTTFPLIFDTVDGTHSDAWLGYNNIAAQTSIRIDEMCDANAFVNEQTSDTLKRHDHDSDPAIITRKQFTDTVARLLHHSYPKNASLSWNQCLTQLSTTFTAAT
ncbi:unnamed protein product [Toxocara canis]|uniref:Secreted protein n=1 Tax=Toxocara canis TaxID=6265 RepID=A0A183U2Y3_TOXCA|nr:unnamed protein product [Toxocara canis]